MDIFKHIYEYFCSFTFLIFEIVSCQTALAGLELVLDGLKLMVLLLQLVQRWAYMTMSSFVRFLGI